MNFIFFSSSKNRTWKYKYYSAIAYIAATKSNYQLKHGGGEPDYMHYFFNVSKENLLFDVLLSEEGTRF